MCCIYAAWLPHGPIMIRQFKPSGYSNSALLHKASSESSSPDILVFGLLYTTSFCTTGSHRFLTVHKIFAIF